MNREAVASFVERAAAAMAEPSSLGKRNTELRVVEPFLSTLDWDVRSPSVTAAYSASNGTTVDYALRTDDGLGAFVLVAAAEDALSVDRRDELVAAMRAADVPRGIYTNGRRYVLLALTPGRGDSDGDDRDRDGLESPAGESADRGDRSVEAVALDLEDLPDRLDALEAVSEDAVAAAVGGDGAAIADALVAADAAAVDAVAETVVDVAREHGSGDVEDVTSDVRPLARQFLEAVVDELGTDATAVTPHADAVEPERQPDDHADGSSRASDVDAADTKERETGVDADNRETGVDADAAEGRAGDGGGDSADSAGDDGVGDAAVAGAGDAVRSVSAASASGDQAASTEYVLRFFEDGRSVGAVGNPSVDAAVAQAVRYLLEERGLGPRVRFPYAPGSDDRAFLNREPVHPDGTRMRSAVDLGGVYVATDADVDDQRSAVEALAERGGLRVMFTGDWP